MNIQYLLYIAPVNEGAFNENFNEAAEKQLLATLTSSNNDPSALNRYPSNTCNTEKVLFLLPISSSSTSSSGRSKPSCLF